MRSACFLFRRYDLCMECRIICFGWCFAGRAFSELVQFHFVLGKLRNFFDNIFEFLPPTELEVIKKLSRNRLVGESLSGFGIRSSLAYSQSLAFVSLSSFSSTPSVNMSLISDCGWVELILFCVCGYIDI